MSFEGRPSKKNTALHHASPAPKPAGVAAPPPSLMKLKEPTTPAKKKKETTTEETKITPKKTPSKERGENPWKDAGEARDGDY